MRRRLERFLLPCLAAVFCAGSAVADSLSGAELLVQRPGSARLTALAGTATLGDDVMSRNSLLSDDTAIETGADGNAAMLVDQDNLLELCASTKVELKRNANGGGRVIEVGSGTTRIIVDPGSSNGPLQISTPAAIATIMGTVVYVTVDPVTGETTIASEDHAVKIESRDPSVSGSTIINGEEQITMRPGEAPQQVQRIAKADLEEQSSCLKGIHGMALDFDRSNAANQAHDRMATADGDVVELPFVGLEGDPLEVEEPAGEEGLDDPSDIIEPFDVVDPPQLDDDLDFPDPCGSIPGDGCFPFPEQPGEETKR